MLNFRGKIDFPKMNLHLSNMNLVKLSKTKFPTSSNCLHDHRCWLDLVDSKKSFLYFKRGEKNFKNSCKAEQDNTKFHGKVYFQASPNSVYCFRNVCVQNVFSFSLAELIVVYKNQCSKQFCR